MQLFFAQRQMPQPSLIRRPLPWLSALIAILTAAAILTHPSPATASELAVQPDSRTQASTSGDTLSAPQSPPANLVQACTSTWFDCVAPGDSTICILSQVCTNYRSTVTSCPGICGAPNTCYRCDLRSAPPPPPPTSPPPTSIPPTSVPMCAGQPLPSSGCVCRGSTLACADGTCAAFNPQCMGSGGGPTKTRTPAPTPTNGPTATASGTPASTATPASDDISIAKTGSATSVIVGQNFSYTLVVANSGPSDAANVTIIDTLPADLAFVSASPAPSSISGQQLSWNLGTISPGTTTITINVTATTTGSNVVNTASVSTTGNDSIPGNNTASAAPVTITAPAYGLSISKTSSTASAVVGQNFTYTLAVTNGGPGNADNVTVSDTLPPELSYVSASPSASVSGQTLSWNLGTLTPGTTNIVVTVDAVSAGAAVINSATAATTSSDPDTSDNSASAAPVAISSPSAGISITKSSSTTSVVVGQNFTYTLTVLNSGPGDASGVSVVDILPAELTYVTDDHTAAVNGRSLTWTLGTLAPGATTIVVTVAANSPGSGILNTATVSATSPDPDLSDNSASAPPVTVSAVGSLPSTATLAPALIAADPAIVKYGTPDHATLGEIVTWSIEVTNPGNTPTNAVSFVDTMPAAFDIQSVIIDGPGSYEVQGQSIAFDLGVLPSAATIRIQIVTVVNNQGRPGEICNALHQTGHDGPPVEACMRLTPQALPDTGFAPIGLTQVGLGLAAVALLGGGWALWRQRQPLHARRFWKR